MSEEGKKRLKELAKQVRDKVATTGAPVLQQRGLDIVEDLAKELTGPDGLPGLKLYRDSPTKFRVQRSRAMRRSRSSGSATSARSVSRVRSTGSRSRSSVTCGMRASRSGASSTAAGRSTRT